MVKKVINSNQVSPSSIFSHAIQAGSFLWVSGQIAMDVMTGQLLNETFEQEVEGCLMNIDHILKTSGYNLKDVIKINIYLTDISLFDRMNKIYLKFFSSNPPARATVEVSKLVKGAKIEIEAVAYKE